MKLGARNRFQGTVTKITEGQAMAEVMVKAGALLTDTGFARIINPGDKSGARNVSNTIRTLVFDPPLPKQDPTP